MSWTLSSLGRATPVRRVLSDSRGVTAIEFAILAPVLFVLLCGIVELAVCFTANVVLQDATKAAARTGRTGYVDDASTRDATVRALLNSRLGTILDERKLVFSSKAYGNIKNIGKPEPYVDVNGNGVRDDGETFTDVNGNGRWDSDSGVNGSADRARSSSIPPPIHGPSSRP